MNQSLLSDLYYGEIHPDKDYRPRYENHRKILHEHLKKTADFQTHLSNIDPNLKRIYNELADELIQSLPLEMHEIYIEGFRLGARLTYEIITGRSSKILESDINCDA